MIMDRIMGSLERGIMGLYYGIWDYVIMGLLGDFYGILYGVIMGLLWGYYRVF